MTSSGMKKVSPTRVAAGKSNSLKSKDAKPSTKGHLYEYQGTRRGKTSDKVIITLRDWTADKELKLDGTIKLENKYVVTTIDNLEDHKNVYLRLHFNGDQGKIENIKGVGWALSPI
jgi:hypothetical protein